MPTAKKRKRRKANQPSSYPFEFRLKVVRMLIEEQYPAHMICQETGVGRSTINTWAKKYWELGEDGLRSSYYSQRPQS